MKKIILYSLLFCGLATMFTACRKNDVQTPPDLRFPLPLLTKDTTGDMFIPGKDPVSFLGKFVVDMYYGTAVKPQKVDIVVIRNDNRTNVKTIKADVTNFPASIEVTGTQLTTLFDSTIKLGDKFEIGADVTTISGQKFEAFPATGNPYGADTAALPGSSFSIVYVAHCKFDVAYFNGYYTVQVNTWDFNVGDQIEVRPGAVNSIAITAWPHPDIGMYIRWPMTIFVDLETLAVTIPWQTTGEYGGGPAIVIEGGTGTVSPCGDAITLSAILWVGYYPYDGQVPLVLRK